MYKVGESAVLFDFKVTVDDVQKADQYISEVLQAGTEFVLVKVTLVNTGKEKKKYNHADFALMSSSSPKPDLKVTTLDNQTELHQGELAPGEKNSGSLFDKSKLQIIILAHYPVDRQGMVSFENFNQYGPTPKKEFLGNRILWWNEGTHS